MTLASMLYLAREGGRSVIRYPGLTMAAVVSMSASLLVFGLFVVLTANVERIAGSIDERKLIDVYVADDLSAPALADLGRQLAAIDGVAALQYISKDEALAAFRHDTERYDLVEALGHNPLPASFRVELAIAARSSARMKLVAAEISGVAGVEEVSFGGEWVERLEALLLTLRVADLIMGILVGLSASFVIGSTIRLTVIARREMIQIMRVVGATDIYIHTPFVVEGIGQSLLAGGLTLLILRAIVGSVSARLGGVEFLGPLGVVLFLGFTALLGLLGSLLSLRTVLRRLV